MTYMKIAHIVSTYPPYYGGMGNVAFEMASRLAARGHTIEVFTPEYRRDNATSEENKTFAEREDFATRLETPIKYGNAAYLPALARELDHFDLVHLHYPFFGSASLVAQWKKRNQKKPLVVTYHMDTRGTGVKGIFFKLYAALRMPAILKSADLLITSSFDYIEHSDACGVYRQTREKWVELPFGVDTNRFQPREKPDFLFDRHGFDSNIPTIIFVGGMDSAHYFKGVPILLKAVSICKNLGMSLQLIAVGEGNLKKEFELQARVMGLEQEVRFAGAASNEELPLYYAMGDVCVLPSTTQGEAFGMVLLEAMACGIPILTSDLPGVRTLGVQGGEVCTPGSPLDLAQLLVNLFSSPDEQERIRVKNRKIVEEKYGWDFIVDKLENEYARLIAR